VKIASTLMGTPFIDNVNGTDLAPALFEFFEDTDTTFAFVGGRPGVAQTAANRVSYQFPNLKKPLPYHGYKSEEEWVALAKELAELRPSIIFVALGVPLQEKRIEMLSQYLPDCLLIGVGGLLDFLAQRIPRAPHLFRAVGCEWVWRLIQEPGRMWRRYLIGNIVFLYRAVYYALKHRG
jgi:N-acetylglucosaminyldiphosphoundecaprenol N-acetyl-beta-D-mannosaminyltransferase